MIGATIDFIKQQLDRYLLLHFGLDDSVVVVNSILGLDGQEQKINQNRVVITMINLDHDKGREHSDTPYQLSNREIVAVSPAQNFNVDLLFTANFNEYTESLKFLDATISFFQTHTSFSSNNNPDLSKGISGLSLDIENLSYSDSNALWSAMGAHYQPSIIYKLRHIIFASEQIDLELPTLMEG